MEALSILLKIFGVLSLLIGLAQLTAGFFKVELFKLPPRRLKVIGAGLVVLAALLGVGDYITTRDKDKDTDQGSDQNGGPAISVQGPITAGHDVRITQTTIDRLEVHPGDSPEEKAAKRTQASRIVAENIQLNLRHLDERLGILGTLLEPDTVGEKLEATRRRVAPALEKTAGEGYGKLMAEQQAASLQEAFNNAPLRIEQGEASQRLLYETNTDPASVTHFYQALEQVEHASDEVVKAVRAPASTPAVSSDELQQANKELHTEELKLAIEALRNQGQYAHVLGLRALASLGIDQATANAALSSLAQLTPKQLISEEEASSLLADIADREKDRVRRRKELVVQNQEALGRTLAQYEELDKELKIQPSDSWEQVVAKARSLRDLGRTGEAVAAFAAYGQMFRDKDPGAEQYANTAQQFTTQLQSLQVPGGIYITQVRPQGALGQAGLQVGDIVVGYNGKPVSDMVAWTQALSDIPPGQMVQITYLRPDGTGGFAQQTAEIEHGVLGAGFMPI